jgi:hypothetical protein
MKRIPSPMQPAENTDWRRQKVEVLPRRMDEKTERV